MSVTTTPYALRPCDRCIWIKSQIPYKIIRLNVLNCKRIHTTDSRYSAIYFTILRIDYGQHRNYKSKVYTSMVSFIVWNIEPDDHLRGLRFCGLWYDFSSTRLILSNGHWAMISTKIKFSKGTINNRLLICGQRWIDDKLSLFSENLLNIKALTRLRLSFA